MTDLVSPLVTCSLDILAMITDTLDCHSLRRLYLTDKTGLRPRLTQYGGVRSFCFYRNSASPPESFPIFSFRFQKLQTLKILADTRFSKTLVLGTMLYLPSSLTHLEMRFEHSMTCWLQPSELAGNNDEGPFEEKFKPIFMDRLLPALRHLTLTGGVAELFSPTPANAPATASDCYFDPPAMSILSPELRHMISNTFVLKMPMKWTVAMRKSWVEHLPKTLNYVHLSTVPQPVSTDTYPLLPPQLTCLNMLNSGTLPNRLSTMPETMRQSLTKLHIAVDNASLDAPFPPHLLELELSCSQSVFPSNAFDNLPNELRKLTCNQYCNISTITALPQTITELKLGSCPLDDLVHLLPAKLRVLQIYLRSYASAQGLKLLPEALKTLEVTGDCTLSSDIIGALPRGLTNLNLDGLSGCLHEDAVLLLPQYLTTLRLGSCSSELGDSTVALLPRTITSLTFSSHRLTDDIATDFPPGLVNLNLTTSRLSESLLPLLPKTLQTLQFGQLQVRGALIPETSTVINTAIAAESVRQHLTPATLAWRKPNEGVRYRDPLFLVYENLNHVSSAVTTIEYPGSSTGVWWTTPKPNLTYLSLPDNTSFTPSKFKCLSALTHLSLPKNSMMKGSWNWFPPGLRYLDISNTIISRPLDTTNDPPQFPSTLTTLFISDIEKPLWDILKPLHNLTSFRLNSAWTQRGEIFHILPRSVTSIEINSARDIIESNMPNLPDQLIKFAAPDAPFTDWVIPTLPRTLKHFQCKSLSIHTAPFYAPCPPMESFTSPSDFMNILKFAPPGSNRPHLPPELTDLKIATWFINLEDSFAKSLPKDLKLFEATVHHTLMTDAFLALLPRNLVHLDLHHQTTGLTSACVPLLPPSLTKLVLHGGEFTEPSVYMDMPRSLTDLELLRAPGRLNATKARDLPRHLTRLRLGICIVGDDALPHLPQSLTLLHILNSPFITDAGASSIPRSVTSLWLPTSRLSVDCVDHLPPDLTTLCLGSGCSVPAGFVLTRLAEKREAARNMSAI